MTKFKGLSNIKKNKEENNKIDRDLVNLYKNAISTLFKTVSFEKDSLGNKNSYYYSDIISKFSNFITKEYKLNKSLNETKEIEIFNRITIDLLKDIVQFFIAVDSYNSTNNKANEYIILSKTNLEDGFKNLEQYDLKIKDFFSKKDSSFEIKEYCLKIIKESYYLLNNKFYIDIEKCPLKYDFDNLIYKLEHSVSNNNNEFVMASNSKRRNIKINGEITFLDFITNIDEKEAFAKELKITFNKETGIDFKIMIELLKDQNIFIIGDRQFKIFHENIKLYFNRKIGEYSGLNDKYKHTVSDKKVHHIRIKNISKKLQPLIDKFKTK